MAIVALFPLLIMGVVFGIAGGRLMKKGKTIPAFKKQEPCEFGKANHEFSHDTNRRIVQLEGFYKDGLIDRREYELLKQRWSEN